MDVRIPNLAEGISSGTIVSLLVREGDTVKAGQTLLELETEKAVAPIPSPFDGKVEKIEAAVGDAVAVGKRVMVLSGAGSATASEPQATELPKRQVPEPVALSKPARSDAGYRYESPAGVPPPSSPSVRKMAREMGLDLTRVRGTEPGGRITAEDVRSYVAALQGAGPALVKTAGAKVDFSRFGPVKRVPMTSLRKKISEKMLASWQSIPHVTQFADADVTELARLREKYVKAYEKAGVRLTLTGLMLKAIAANLKKHPVFNASLDEEAGEVVYKDYCHIGLAVDTEQGLIVPVIRDAGKKSVLELSLDIATLAEKTRTRKIAIEDLQGGSFTLSNQGGIGGTHFTPIINHPEVAILGLGRASLKTVVKMGKIVKASIMPVSLSYDHRLIDGGSAARFITDLVEAFERFDETFVKLEGTSKTAAKPKPARKKRKS
ncbi:MAG: 2-oxo acid dehydrogenase subunit E2 [Candidatus Omnitrophota bacterium]|jgi:pyruvate dehydrogenase E2 component (dihydrolipoamide acetyltransferase)